MHNFGQPHPYRMRMPFPRGKRPDMNVGNGPPLTPAQMQQLVQMGINPNHIQLMGGQPPQTNGLPQHVQPPPQSVAAVAAQHQAAQHQAAAAAAAAAQQHQQQLHQQQQQQQQAAAAAAAAAAHAHPHTPHVAVPVTAAPVVHMPQPQPNQAHLMQHLQQLQAAHHAHHAQTQQAQLAQLIQQANLVNAIANPVCPPPPPGVPSMPWPVTSPICHIPYFDMNMYRSVNIEAMPSHDQSGMDLPLTDISTLRFFFNFGVQQSRNLIAARSSQQQQNNQPLQPPQQQQQISNIQEAIAAAASNGQNPANLINMINNAAAQNPNAASLEQLNALLGQHSMLRQAQQLQGNPAQVHLQQANPMQQQLNTILTAAQSNQRQIQNQAYAQSHALQQHISVLMNQIQPQQIAGANVPPGVPVQQIPNERKTTHSDLIAANHVHSVQTPIGIAQTAQVQQLNAAAAQAATTPTSQPIVQQQQIAVPQQPQPQSQQPQQVQQVQPGQPGQPQASSVQTLQKTYENQTLLLQHALFQAHQNTQSKQPTLHEIRLQALAQQQASSSSTSPATGLHPFIRPTEANKQSASSTPIAALSSSESTNISPRPPIPLDPSPPHVVISKNESPNSDKQQQQTEAAQASSTTDEDAKPSSSAQVASVNPIGIANPMAVSSTAIGQRVTATTPSNTTNSPTTNSSATSSGNNIPPLIQISEDHFTDTFRKSEQKRQQGHLNPSVGQAGSPKTNGEQNNDEESGDKPALAPILMMSYLNTCMSQAKTQLNANGVHVGVDDNGQIVDFTSRPIDPIFKDAREDLIRARDYKRPHPASATATAIVGNNISISSPNQPTGSSPKAEIEASSMPAPSMPIGINRSAADVIPSLTPKAECEEPIINVVGPEDDSEDDSVGGKRIRIATDEE